MWVWCVVVTVTINGYKLSMFTIRTKEPSMWVWCVVAMLTSLKYEHGTKQPIRTV